MLNVLSDETLWQLLHDDVPQGDLTTDLLLDPDQPIQIAFSARQEMTVCATEEAARMFVLVDAQVECLVPSGHSVAADTTLLRAWGSTAALFMAWKAAQVLVEWASGLSTATRQLVMAAGSVPVACTRKQVPGTKLLATKAVRAGGGIMHRHGLSETILVFAEHRQFLTQPSADTVQLLRHRSPEHKIVVEVHDETDAQCWILAGADVIQMDKFSPDQVAAIAHFCHEHHCVPVLAAAGGVHAGNATDYVTAGATLLVTSAPYHAAPKDVAVRFDQLR
jgi:molybdenum transport protein